MAFPADPLPLIGEIKLAGQTTWTKITELGGVGKVRAAQEVVISRGRRNVQGNLPPGTADFTIDNRDGTFTNNNPLSPYYKLLPRYTPVRFRLNDANIPSYAAMGGSNTGDRYEAPLASITGDIDIRVDCEPFQWSPSQPKANTDSTYTMMASQVGTNFSTQYGWTLMLKADNRLWFSWSPDGTFAARRSFFSPVFVPTGPRMAFRVTLQVNNGASQCVARFYSAPTIDDTFVQFGAFSQSGATSIYAGGGNLEIGSAAGGTAIFVNSQTWGGRIYAFSVRNGIGGTVLANADFRALVPETASFSDSTGKVWVPKGNVGVGSDAVRFAGEIESLPQEWDLTGRENVVSAHASDQIYRYSVNSTALLSPIEQYITSKFKTLTGYWPMQDESTSLTAASNIFGSQPATASGMRFQGDTTLPGADGAASMGNSGAYMRGATVTTSPKGAVSMLFWFKLTTIPTVQTSIISFTMVGTPVKWYRVSVDNVNFYVDVYGQDGTLLFGYSALKGANTVLSDWICMRFQVSDTGSGGYRSGITWRSIYSDTSYIVTDALAGSPGTVGTCVAFTFGPGANAPDVALSNVAIMQELFDFEDPNLHLASKAFSGELAGARFLRLASLAGIAGYLEGWNFETMALGPQPRGAVLDLMRDLEKADGGILSGTRWRLGLTYITRACISGRYSTMTLSHAASHLSFAPKPVEDSYGVTNDFTANRSGGSSARSVVSTGSLGTGSIGTVAGADTYNALDDTQLPSLAGWQTALGTWDEPRFPDVQIALERPETPLNSTLGRSIISMDIGRNFVLSNLPTHQPPGPYELLAQGYSEALGNRTMRTDWSTTPYGPWRAFRMGDPFITPRFQVADTVILSAGASDTLLTFVTPGSTKKILTSGTFEEPGAAALAAWFAVSCTIVQSNTVANSGTYSMQLTVVGSPSFAYARQLDAYKPPVTVGTRYRCYLLARSPLASPDVAAVIDWYDASYVYISSSSTTVALVANTWTYIQVDAVAPAGAAYAAYGPTIGSSPAAGKVVYVDDVYFRDLSVAGSTRWITSPEMPSAFPMNVMIGGEKMTVTALTNLGEVQTATVTRAVNGISKAQTDGTPVQLNPITTFSR